MVSKSSFQKGDIYRLSKQHCFSSCTHVAAQRQQVMGTQQVQLQKAGMAPPGSLHLKCFAKTRVLFPLSMQIGQDRDKILFITSERLDFPLLLCYLSGCPWQEDSLPEPWKKLSCFLHSSVGEKTWQSSQTAFAWSLPWALGPLCQWQQRMKSNADVPGRPNEPCASLLLHRT